MRTGTYIGMSVVPRPLIIKIDAAHHRLDSITGWLIENGFQVVKAASIKEGIKLARRSKPTLIVAIDNPKAGLDAAHWLEIQHSDTESTLAMTPLLIVADTHRATRLYVHELPDRVKVLPKPLTAELLLAAAHHILNAWQF